ncbi:ABC transporter substrate-binding protein [Streptomonospora salina]|uniref:NitT/TauT family transport system substrate-binding protein n=2 Tax=Streptomonospora salina TaxID=104205 RepID=A0A841E324_9ACTN|nr:ABC transporter substrate-binding protein [Streptomonospora salina]MBB5997092.1 NitT/TauT family transport system substrate-binding protein [Streptomonospora salina]
MRRMTLPVAAVVTLLASTACGGGGQEGGDGDGGGNKSVTVGAIPIVDVAPLHLGADQGIFDKHGIDLEIENTTGGAQAVPSVVSGDYDFAFGNITSIIVGRSNDLPLTIVSNGVTSTGEQGADFGGVVAPEGSDITDAKDLEDKTVAVNNLENIGDTTVRNSIREDGGDSDTVEFVELPFPEMPAALDRGDVDAAWVVEPFLTSSLNGGATEVASNFVDADPDLSVAYYFTTEQMINEDPELVDDFTAAINESLTYAEDNPDAARDILGDYTELDSEAIDQIRLPRWPTENYQEPAQSVADLMMHDGVIESQPDMDALFR